MEFEWDDAKDQANVVKHGIAFATARRIFGGVTLTREDSRRDYGETRDISIGEVDEAVIVVAHTRREERVRLISARPASRKERKAYHEHTQNR